MKRTGDRRAASIPWAVIAAAIATVLTSIGGLVATLREVKEVKATVSAVAKAIAPGAVEKAAP